MNKLLDLEQTTDNYLQLTIINDLLVNYFLLPNLNILENEDFTIIESGEKQNTTYIEHNLKTEDLSILNTILLLIYNENITKIFEVSFYIEKVDNYYYIQVKFLFKKDLQKSWLDLYKFLGPDDVFKTD